MTQIEIWCYGKRLRDGGPRAHESKPDLIDVFEGTPSSLWDTIRRKPRRSHLARLRGEGGDTVYMKRRTEGEEGRAEAARRSGRLTEQQQRLLDLSPRQNYNLPCSTCTEKLTRDWSAVQRALQRIAALVEKDPIQARALGMNVPSDADMPIKVTLQLLRGVAAKL